MSVNLKDALLHLPAIVGPGASSPSGSGLAGPGLGTAAGGALGTLAGPLGSLAGAGIGWLADNVLSGIRTRSARKWQEDMYNDYNSPSALVRQYQDAGVNPALMFGSPTPAAPTDTSAASVSQLNTGSMADILGQFMQLSLLDAQRENIKADTANKQSETSFRDDYETAYRAAQTLNLDEERKYIKEISDARSASDRASAAYHFAEAAISKYERSVGHRLKGNDLLAIVDSIGQVLKPGDNDAESIATGIANAVVGMLGDDEMTIPEAIGGPLAHLVASKVRARLKEHPRPAPGGGSR